MDQFDRATQLEEQHRELALAQQALQRAQTTGASAFFCIDCGVDIPEARRQAVPGCQRCIDCQTRHEQRARMLGGKP